MGESRAGIFSGIPGAAGGKRFTGRIDAVPTIIRGCCLQSEPPTRCRRPELPPADRARVGWLAG